MINLHVQAADVAELHAKLAGMLAGHAPRETGGTEAAATAPASSPKRGRSAKNSTSIEAAAEQNVPQNSDNNAATQNESIGHTAAPDSVQNSTAEEKKSEGPLPDAASVGGGAQPTAASPTAPTRDEVIAALNVYSAPRGGQVAGRTKMQEVCGVNRLQDIKPEDYGKLIAALKAAEAK